MSLGRIQEFLAADELPDMEAGPAARPGKHVFTAAGRSAAKLPVLSQVDWRTIPFLHPPPRVAVRDPSLTLQARLPSR